jgi:hypothetical protein
MINFSQDGKESINIRNNAKSGPKPIRIMKNKFFNTNKFDKDRSMSTSQSPERFSLDENSTKNHFPEKVNIIADSDLVLNNQHNC